MEKLTQRELKLTCQLQALEMLVVTLARRAHTAEPPVGEQSALMPENPFQGLGIHGHPEASDLFVAELQEAWDKLRQQVLAPEA